MVWRSMFDFRLCFWRQVLLMPYWSPGRLGELPSWEKLPQRLTDGWDRTVSAHQFTIKGSSDVFYMCLGLFSPASRGHVGIIWICMKRPPHHRLYFDFIFPEEEDGNESREEVGFMNEKFKMKMSKDNILIGGSWKISDICNGLECESVWHEICELLTCRYYNIDKEINFRLCKKQPQIMEAIRGWATLKVAD